MPDISMCINQNCSKKKSCYRFMAEPSDWQSYVNYDHRNCKSYWEMDETQAENSKKAVRKQSGKSFEEVYSKKR